MDDNNAESAVKEFPRCFRSCTASDASEREFTDSLGILIGAIVARHDRMLQPHTRLQWGLTDRILGVYHDVHSELGDGYLESVFQAAMVIALKEAGLDPSQDARFTVTFRGYEIGHFVPDIIVNGLVLLEIKSCHAIEPRHKAQLLNYLRVSTIEVGLLLNFGPKPAFERLILTNDRKQRRHTSE